MEHATEIGDERMLRRVWRFALWYNLRLLIGGYRRRFYVRFLFVFPRIGCRRVHFIPR
jgi:hypothetical protein